MHYMYYYFCSGCYTIGVMMIAFKILRNCKKAISGKERGGKVIIIDAVINENQDEHEMTEVKLLLDVVMMTCFNRRERNEKEWKQLFLQAGFKY